MRRPTWKAVESSMMQYIYFNRNNKELSIIFNSGATYIYYNVSYYRYRKLRLAESKGKYFNANINGKYEYRRTR